MRIGIFGAGSIGCYLGGMLAAAGGKPILVGRPAMRDRLLRGLYVSRYDSDPVRIDPSAFSFATDPVLLSGCDAVLVCVKSADTAAAGDSLAQILPPGGVVASFQNGISNARTLQQALPRQTVLAAMVGFNVAQIGGNRFHCGTQGEIFLEHAPAAEPLCAALNSAGIECHLRGDMAQVQWGKLLLNLNNAVNALSGLPLRQQLSTRSYRRALALAVAEALAVLHAAGIRPARIGKVPPDWIPFLLRLPDTVFLRVAASMLRIDEKARSSMAEDLERGRESEIDWLNGEIVRLGTETGRAAPVNARLVELVRQASKCGAPPAIAGEALLLELEKAQNA